MSLTIRFLLSMLCIFPAAVAIYKYKRVDKSFRPFIFMMWLEVIVEPIDYLIKKIPNFISVGYVLLNCYMLLNFFLFLFFIIRFNFISKNKMKILFALALVIGIINLIYFHPKGMLYYLLIYVCFVMLALAIDIISKQIMAIKQPLINNFWFWMSGTSVIYNSQTLLVFGIYFLVMLNVPNSRILGNIQTISNSVCYVLFGITMLKMPEIFKNTFIRTK